MLSSAIILIAFALATGAGGYVTLSLYRAAAGAPRSRPGPEDAGVPEETAFGGPDDPGAPNEPEQAEPEQAEPDQAQAAQPDDAPGPANPADPANSPGARVYVLRQPPV